MSKKRTDNRAYKIAWERIHLAPHPEGVLMNLSVDEFVREWVMPVEKELKEKEKEQGR